MSIGATIGKYAIKAVGVTAAGLLAYDAHKEGQHVAKTYANEKDFKALDYYYENTRNMNSPSHLNAHLKDKLYHCELRENLRHFVNSAVGYVKGFTSMFCDDLIPWGISAATIFTKGTAAKISAGALGLYSAYAFLKNVCGVGTRK